MTLFAWNSYKEFAWGLNELRPLSKTGHTPGIYGKANKLGATIVDSLDTLYIMGLMDQYNEGREWVKTSFNFNDIVNSIFFFFFF
jgi:mannosyl-oligosaccharide alpha-1,2-mannosidase